MFWLSFLYHYKYFLNDAKLILIINSLIQLFFSLIKYILQARIKSASTYGKTDRVDRRCLVSHAVIYNCFVLFQLKWFG